MEQVLAVEGERDMDGLERLEKSLRGGMAKLVKGDMCLVVLDMAVGEEAGDS